MSDIEHITTVEQLAALAERIIQIQSEADGLFYDGRIFKSWTKWHNFVNERSQALPELLNISGEAEDILRAYASSVEEYRSSHAFIKPVAMTLWSIARIDIPNVFLNFAKIGRYLNGLEDAKQATELFKICYAIERQYCVTNIDADRKGICATRALYVSTPSAYGSHPSYEGGIFLESWM